jgi:hypothetical protein
MKHLFNKDDVETVSGEPTMIVAYVCWDCETFLVETGQNSSQGPYCYDCEERLETFNIVGQDTRF